MIYFDDFSKFLAAVIASDKRYTDCGVTAYNEQGEVTIMTRYARYALINVPVHCKIRLNDEFEFEGRGTLEQIYVLEGTGLVQFNDSPKIKRRNLGAVKENWYNCRTRWTQNTWLSDASPSLIQDLRELSTFVTSWQPYEEYMEAGFPYGDPIEGEPTLLLIRFPPDKAEANELHTHPESDRIVTILEGSGVFEAKRLSSGSHYMLPVNLSPGTCIFMPRNTLHTFRAGPDGLLVASIHNPWIPLDDPRAYQPKA